MSKRDSGLFLSGSFGRVSGAQIARNSSHESLTSHPLLSPPPAHIPGSGLASSGSSISSTHSTTTDGTSVGTTSTATATSTSSPASTKYVPYTPRQRGPVTTISTTMQSAMGLPSSPSSSTSHVPHHPSTSSGGSGGGYMGDATSKLQLMNLKAAAQKGGLDAASTGWAILEKLGTETDHGPEWNEVWNAISVGKATLLLPLENHPVNEPITPEFMKDHLAICEGPNRTHAPIITLSGLRGILEEETFTIRSTIDPTSNTFQALLNPATRSSTLASLPPLPLFTPFPPILETPTPLLPSPASSPVQARAIASNAIQYPTYNLPLHHSHLPLPPRPPPPSFSASASSSPAKPPLPPRPGNRSTSLNVSSPPTVQSRLSNPFASLFGRTATPEPTPPPPIPPLAVPGSPTTSITSLHSADPPSDQAPPSSESITVGAFTVNTKIVRKDVARTLLRSLHNEIRLELGPSPPNWVVDRIEEFALKQGLMPFVKVKPKTKLGRLDDSTSGGLGVGVGVGGGGGYVVGKAMSAEGGGIEVLGREFQDFYASLREELLRRKWGSGGLFSRGRMHREGPREFHGQGHQHQGSTTSSAENTVFDDKGEEDEKEKEKEREEDPATAEKEKKVCEVLEAVERTVCSLFYDRLFLPASSDDAHHDEALSSRIAAVNLLDLTLGHLGVDVGQSEVEVASVVAACGETLTQLDVASRSPADKAAVLVAAHKIIVDGLSRLPPIKLKDAEDILDEKTPRAGSFGKHSAEDDNEVSSPIPTADSSKTVTNITATTTVTSPESEVPPPIEDKDTDHTPKAPPPSSSLTIEVPERPTSPLLTISPAPPSTPTPVSGDLILPLMIYAVVKANPPRLVSHLLYIQRFRNESVGGEESYCLINLLAVAEFLENVDLAALGLGESQNNVISAAELTPIPVARVGSSEPSSPRSKEPSLRGRVEQQVDAIAGSANKVISGVVDSSFGVLRSFLPGQTSPDPATSTSHNANDTESQEAAPWNTPRTGFGLLRRDTMSSIANIAAALPGGIGRPMIGGGAKKDEETGQQMHEVPSRPGSSRSIRVEDATSSSEVSSDEESEDEEDGDEDEDDGGEAENHDTRSIRSFESMMSKKGGKKTRRKGRSSVATSGRKSIADRLASVPGLSRLSHSAGQDASGKGSPPESRRSSLLLPHAVPSNRFDTPVSSRGASPVAIRIPPPNQRFLEATADDIRVSEVAELLSEYKRLVEVVRAVGGFHDE